MGEPLELPEAYAHLDPDYIGGLAQHFVDRELERALLRDRGDYAERRAHMPREVRQREDRVMGQADA